MRISLLILLVGSSLSWVRAQEPSPYDLAAQDYRRGLELTARHDLTAAVASYDRAITLNPKFGLAYFRLAAVEAALGRVDAAAEHLKFAAANTKDTAILAAIAKDQATLAAWKPALPALPDLERYAPWIAAAPLLFVVGLVALAALGRAKKAPEPSPAWVLEPELQNPALPRNVVWSQTAKKQLLLMTGILLTATLPLLLSFLVTPALRAYMRSAGLRADATVDRVTTRLESSGGKRPHMVPRTHVVLSYAGAPPVDYRVRAPRFASGQTVSVHYLPSSPRWVSLDDDPDAPLLWVPLLACVISAFAIAGALLFSTRPFTVRRAVQNGIVVPVKIENLIARGKSGYYARVSYVWQGAPKNVEIRLFDSTGIFQGRTLTAFVDPERPDAPVIYRGCWFQVVPTWN